MPCGPHVPRDPRTYHGDQVRTFALLVKRFPDGDLACALTRSQDEVEFRLALGYERVSRPEWQRAVDEVNARQRGEVQPAPQLEEGGAA